MRLPWVQEASDDSKTSWLSWVIFAPTFHEGILITMSEGVNVVGTLAWSILDNLEWGEGFTVKFGMQHGNFTTQERHFKSSFFEYINVFRVYQQNYTGLEW
jgi:beta-glucosidase/6-phospho-beta-glucosidase/beta-galactosidase